MRAYLVLAVVSALASGCVLSTSTPGGGDDSIDPSVKDGAAYDALASKLAGHRERFLGKEADELQAATQRLFWLQYPTFDPTLHSARGARIDYGFPLGSEGNYRASDDLVVTATRDGDAVVYRAYAADAPSTLRGQVSLPAPTDAQRWWAYAVDGTTVYIVSQGGTVQRWSPGAPPVVETTLAQATIDDVFVTSGRMLIVESGRLWIMPLATHHATWVGNKQQITGGISTDDLGVLYTEADGPFYQPFAGGEPRDVRAEIAANPYALNRTFATIHLYDDQAVLSHGTIVYKGQTGLFAYTLSSHAVAPVALEPRNASPRIVYIDPQVLDDGTIYVTGLESESGSVGADGPVYRIKLSDVRSP